MSVNSVRFWRDVCGCTVGSWSAVGAIAYCLIATPLPGAALWIRVAASAGIILGAAITGKILALTTARAMLLALER